MHTPENYIHTLQFVCIQYLAGGRGLGVGLLSMLPSGYSHSETSTVAISNLHNSRKRSRVGGGAPSGQAETRMNWLRLGATTKRSSHRKSLVALLVLCRLCRVVLCSGYKETPHGVYTHQHTTTHNIIASRQIITKQYPRQPARVTNACTQHKGILFLVWGFQGENSELYGIQQFVVQPHA